MVVQFEQKHGKRYGSSRVIQLNCMEFQSNSQQLQNSLFRSCKLGSTQNQCKLVAIRDYITKKNRDLMYAISEFNN